MTRRILDLREARHDLLDEVEMAVEQVSARAGAHAAIPLHEVPVLIEQLREQMVTAANDLDFERAATLRDEIRRLSQRELLLRDPSITPPRARSVKRPSRRRAAPRR